MNSSNNSIFFNTLRMYARDSSAVPAISAAVEDVLAHAPDFYPAEALEEKQARTNIHWMSVHSVDVREQIIALSTAIQKYAQKNGGKKHIQEAPALARLEHIEIAIAMYRYLQKKKAAINHIVENTQNRTQATYKAIIKSNLSLIKEMRQQSNTRPWTTISRTLHALTGHKIPSTTISKLVAEIDSGLAKYEPLSTLNRGTPRVMTRWEGDNISEETRAAYEKAGYRIEEQFAPADDTAPKNTTMQTATVTMPTPSAATNKKPSE